MKQRLLGGDRGSDCCQPPTHIMPTLYPSPTHIMPSSCPPYTHLFPTWCPPPTHLWPTSCQFLLISCPRPTSAVYILPICCPPHAQFLPFFLVRVHEGLSAVSSHDPGPGVAVVSGAPHVRQAGREAAGMVIVAVHLVGHEARPQGTHHRSPEVSPGGTDKT